MIIPIIFDKDFELIKRKVHLIDRVAEIVQIDVADGVLVNGTTFLDLNKLDELDTDVKFELHFMVKDPTIYLNQRIHKVKKVISQIEAGNIDIFISKARKLGYEVGLSINPETPNSSLTRYLTKIDYVQFMTVIPGGPGRMFISKVLDKIREFKMEYPEYVIQNDGGVTRNNIKTIKEAGVNNIGVNSAIFKRESPAAAKQELDKLVS